MRTGGARGGAVSRACYKAVSNGRSHQSSLLSSCFRSVLEQGLIPHVCGARPPGPPPIKHAPVSRPLLVRCPSLLMLALQRQAAASHASFNSVSPSVRSSSDTAACSASVPRILPPPPPPRATRTGVARGRRRRTTRAARAASLRAQLRARQLPPPLIMEKKKHTIIMMFSSNNMKSSTGNQNGKIIILGK